MNEENPIVSAGEVPPADRTVTRFSLKVNKTLEMLNHEQKTEEEDEFGDVREVEDGKRLFNNRSSLQGRAFGAGNAVMG